MSEKFSIREMNPTFLHLVNQRRQDAAEARAFGRLRYADLLTAQSEKVIANPLTQIEDLDPEAAVPRVLAALGGGAVVFQNNATPTLFETGELLFSSLRPDGVQDLARIPQANLIRLAQAMAARYQFTPKDRIFIGGTLNDILFWLALAAAFASGMTVTMDPEGATVLWNFDPDRGTLSKSVRVVHIRELEDKIAELQARYPTVDFVNGLVLTEAGGLPVCSDPRDPQPTVTSTCGRPLPGMEVMIVDPNTGMDMLLYETGEIWLRGCGIMSGYSSGIDRRDPSRFLPSGLFGHLDSEGRVVLQKEQL